MIALTPYEVAEYLAAASAAGIVGDSAYAGVQGLVAWMRKRFSWSAARPLDPDLALTDGERRELAALYDGARAEWQRAQVTSVNATQTVRAGRDINAPIINEARTIQRDP
jgi:hypothetical protein